MNFKVTSQSLDEYVRIAKALIEEEINSYYNESFVFNIDKYNYSVNFLKEYLILLEIEANTIINIFKVTYKNLWNYDFINWFADNIILRILYKDGYFNLKIEKFFSIFENDLYMEFITLSYNKLFWPRYDLTLKLKNEDLLQFVRHLKSVAT